MKALFTTLILTTTVISAFCQENKISTDHMTFKGVPIDGTLNEFISEMKKSGFDLIGTEDGFAMFQGDFAGYKDCTIGVATLEQKDLVSKIAVIFPEQDTWSYLSSNYFNLKELLTEKYGDPSEVVEKFNSYTEPDDDNSKMHEVKFDNCKYYTIYETEKGSIQLSIEHESVISCFVTLTYTDKQNSEIIRAKAIDDL